MNKVQLGPKEFSAFVSSVEELYAEVIDKQDLNKLLSIITDKNSYSDSNQVAIECQNCKIDFHLNKELHKSML